MTVTFFSNFFNDHQRPFCEAMYKRLGGDFTFVATEPMSDERKDLGFKDDSDRYPYVLKAFASEEKRREALRLGVDSDVAIIGSAPDFYITERLKNDKLTFRYCERFFKQGRIRILDPRVFLARYKCDFRYRKKNLRMLCASAYTAPDCRFIFSYPNKTYKWGYFRDVPDKTFAEIESRRSGSVIKILWVARFIPLKHPEEPLEVAEKLKKDGINFRLKMIGVGELREKCEKTAREKGLSDKVSFAGPISPQAVMAEMEEADIFLFTSDRNEGWGAVLNEAMASGLAAIACREIGSAPYLIEDGKNGLLYSKKKNELYEKTVELIRDGNKRKALSENAYDTIHSVWNAETAAERLLSLIDRINKGEDSEYLTGPLAKD